MKSVCRFFSPGPLVVIMLFFCAAYPQSAVVPARQAATVSSVDRIDRYIASEMKAEHIPGLALGIYRHGKLVKAKGYGIANLEHNVLVKPETVFAIGSVTKQFTATAIMMLVDEGKLSLEDSITKYLDGMPETWAPIKIKHLLSHTSGLSEYNTVALQKPGAPFDPQQNISRDEFFHRLARLPVVFAPGEQCVYRNTNYALLGGIIEKVTGQFWGDFLRGHIFGPLGMNTARVESALDLVPNRASGYWPREGKLQNEEWVAPTFATEASGALLLSVLDFGKWDNALYTGRLLKKTTLDQMWTVFKLNNGQPNDAHRGLGWQVEDINGHRVIEHEGSMQGFSAMISRYVDDGLTVVVLVNLNFHHVRVPEITHQVAGLLDPRLDPKVPQAITDPDPKLTLFLRGVVGKLQTGTADIQDFTPDMQANFFPDFARQIGEYFRSQGPVDTFELLERGVEGNDRTSSYRVHFRDGGYFTLTFSVAQDGKISKMGFQN